MQPFTARRVACAMSALALVVAQDADGATPPRPACLAVAFAPDFRRDPTVFCLADRPGGGLVLFASRTAGRTWDGGRTVTDRDIAIPEVATSPGYHGDGTVFVMGAEQAMWISTDSGRTFTEASRAPRRGLLGTTPYQETVPSPHAALVEAPLSVLLTSVYDAVTGWREVAGTPTTAFRFLVPPDFATHRTAVAVGREPGAYRGDEPIVRAATRAYRCGGDFICAVPVFDFGEAEPYDSASIGPADDFLLTVGRGKGGGAAPTSSLRAWRSRDYGESWSRWPELEALVLRLRDGETLPAVTITKSPDAPRRLFLHASHWKTTSRTQAGWQIWRSDDDGRTWTRTGLAWGPRQGPGLRSTLPWNDAGRSAPASLGWISAQPGGLLYALGARHDGRRVVRQGLWCSSDGGRIWRETC